jgi:LETM1 and EF-hand domain-containing protein 1
MNDRKVNQMLISLRKTTIVPIISSIQMINESKLIWKRLIHDLKHYYHDFKLLFIETKTTFHLFYQILNGHTLTR